MKITVITAVYNRAASVGQALDSVAGQTGADLEHLIIDGASTDGTLDQISAHSHPRMRLVSEPDRSIYDALNKGIAAATGEVIGLIHSDDFFANSSVLESVAWAFSDTGADAVYGDLDYVSARDPDKIIRHWTAGTYSRRKLAHGWMPPHPTLFVRREVFESFGDYDTSYRIAADYEAILRWFGKCGVTPAYLPQVLVKMRVGGESNRSIGRILRKSREDYRALKSTGVGGIGALAWKNLSKLPQFLKK